MHIKRWSTTAGVNIYTVPNGAPEGWLGADVNNWGRETMAAVRDVWEVDEWRDITYKPDDTRYAITRDSDTQITIGAVDLSAVLFVGQTIKLTNTVAALKYGRVLTVTFSTPNTVVTIDWDEGQVDAGTSLLTTGTLEVDISGTDKIVRTTGSWVTDGFVTGDRLRLVSTLNPGFYTVGSTITATDMDIVPVQSGYALVTEAAGAFAAYRINTADAAPAAPLEALYITGAHEDEIRLEDVVGTDPLEIPSNELLGDAAYKRESDLSVAVAAAVSPQGSGSGLDADTVDGIEAVDLGFQTFEHTLTADWAAAVGSAEQDVVGLTQLALPGVPDSSKRYLMRIRLRGNRSGSAAETWTWRVYNGSTGDKGDTQILSHADSLGTGSTSEVGSHSFVWTPTTGDTKIGVSVQFGRGDQGPYAVDGASYASTFNDGDDDNIATCYIHVTELGN